MTRKPLGSAVALVAALVTLLAGCGSLAAASKPDDGPVDRTGMTIGPGITPNSIQLGVLTDLSGPYAPLGRSVLQAERLYVDQVNASGGVCGRKLKLLVRDHGYSVDKAVVQYMDMEPSIAAMPGLLGSSIINALMSSIGTDEVMTMALGYSSTLLGQPTLQTISATYDIDMINGLDWAAATYGLKRGDKVGYIYLKGDYGHNALRGAKFVAHEKRLKLVSHEISEDQDDVSAQVHDLAAAGVKAVLITASPEQTASAVGNAAAQGLLVPFLSSAAGFHPQMLKSPAAPAVLSMLHLVAPTPALTDKAPQIEKLVEEYQKHYPGQPLDQGVENGHNTMAVAVQDLKEACADKDLSREGIIAAHRKLTGFDPGMGPALDFSDPWRPSATQSYILKPQKDVPGGLVDVKGPFKVAAVEKYLSMI
ncbi:ABC transporter substrate-binding protein [Streptomyces sp. MI02-7b]|uniref:ABC transporter substrate-binding protein n=1 Tax=Streptomyces sp. MI02-7b TaxID=462941 RepID=UPI0029AAEBC1|nr:ABC transporter substrate-binding protein [Streptomyces sp. MI02-7b]MDX3076318.1 ABC transporter substrate-binding protein [Streptomyces sp. MI02-7b]